MPSAPENVPAEETAWAEVLAAWEDEERHRAYLARFTDLDGLAVAGRRYREILAARPGDALASRFRDEVLKRAMAQGLMSLPRTKPPGHGPRTLYKAIVFGVAAALGAATLWILHRIGVLVGAAP